MTYQHHTKTHTHTHTHTHTQMHVVMHVVTHVAMDRQTDTHTDTWGRASASIRYRFNSIVAILGNFPRGCR